MEENGQSNGPKVESEFSEVFSKWHGVWVKV
jgi:hypothetical protein